MKTFFLVLLTLSSLSIIVTTLLMEPKQQGAGSAFGASQTGLGQTAQGRKEALLQKITIVSAIVFMISAILVTVL